MRICLTVTSWCELFATSTRYFSSPPTSWVIVPSSIPARTSMSCPGPQGSDRLSMTAVGDAHAASRSESSRAYFMTCRSRCYTGSRPSHVLQSSSGEGERMPDQEDREKFDGDYARDTHRGGLGDDYARDGGWSGAGRAEDHVR